MTLRNVPKSYTLEEQRQEINLVAADLDTAVDGVQTFSGDKTFSDNVYLPDGSIIHFGDDNDLKIYFEPSTGGGHIEAPIDLKLQTGRLIVNDAANTAVQLIANQNGSVELYYNAVKKFETSSTGATVTGTIIADGLSVGDNENLDIGNDADLRLYHDAADSYIKERGTGNLYIDSTAGSVNIRVNDTENAVVATQDGSVALYHNGILKAETATSGLRVNNYLYSSGDLTIVSGGTILSRSHMILPNSTTAAFEINGSTSGAGGITIDSGLGSVRLQHNGATKLSTTSSGVSITGTASATEFSGALTGNADTATALATARTIAGQSFDGTANITIAATDLSDTDQALATTSDVTFNTVSSTGLLTSEEGLSVGYGTSSASTVITRWRSDVVSPNSTVASINADGTASFTGSAFEASSGDTTVSIGDSTNTNGRLILTAKTNTVEIHSRSNHPIDFLFNTTAKATLGINGDLSLAGGITLTGQTNGSGATSDTFDHYEEGTWTPTPYYQNAGDQSAASFTTANGYYTRIGNIVHVSGYVVCSGPASPANDNVGISSFPYNNALNVPAVGTIMFENNGTGDVNIRINAGASLAAILTTNGTGNLGDELGTSWSASFQITYRVA